MPNFELLDEFVSQLQQQKKKSAKGQRFTLEPSEEKHSVTLAKSFGPKSLDDEKRTIEAVYMDFNETIRRYSWGGEYYIKFKKGAGRLDRFEAGRAPFLKDHDSSSIDNVIGVIESADETIAKVRFDDNEQAERYYKSVKNGILLNVSVGVSVYEIEDITPETEDEDDYIPPVFLITDYEPHELSLVTIPAIPKAAIFSKNTPLQKKKNTQSLKPEDEFMPKPNDETSKKKKLKLSTDGNNENENPSGTEPDEGEDQTTGTPAEGEEEIPAEGEAGGEGEADAGETMSQAKLSERNRIFRIQSLVKEHGLEDKFAEKLIKNGTSVKDAKTEILEARVRRQELSNTSIDSRIYAGTSENEVEMAAIEASLLHRMNPAKNPFPQDNKFARMTMLDLAKHCLRKAGRDVENMSATDIAWQALTTTSDYPKALENVVNKTLLQSYSDTARTFVPFCTQKTASDFKPLTGIDLSEFDKLDKLPENGEYRYGSIVEGRERYALATFGKIAQLSRRLIINDDIGVLGETIKMMGEAAARMEADIVYSELIGTASGSLQTSPTMGDGGKLLADNKALFHADHANSIAADLIVDTDSEAGVDAVEQLLMAQKGPKGEATLGLTGKFLIYGPKNKLAAKKLLTSTTPTKAADVNPYAGEYEPIQEHRITDKRFILVADNARIPTIEYAYLLGQSTPFTERQINFNNDALDLKIRHDFGAKVMNYRGFARGTES